MRVAFVATSYPSEEGDPSGHFVRAEALARRRDESGQHEVHVIAPRPCEDPGIRAHAAGGAALFAWPGAVARAREAPFRTLAAAPFVARAARLLDSLSPDRIVAHWMLPCAFPIAAISACRAPLDVVCHGADVRLLGSLPLVARDAIVSAVLERADRVRPVARSLLDALLASVSRPIRARLEAIASVVPPSVDVSSAVSAPARDRYVVAAGRLVSTKRLDLAVQAAGLSKSRLVVIGDGPESERLQSIASQRAPGLVSFLGRLPRPEALGWIQNASALLHTSAVEAAPTVVLEALALGVPVIACESGDLADWSSRNARIRLCSADAASIANALLPFVG